MFIQKYFEVGYVRIKILELVLNHAKIRWKIRMNLSLVQF